MDQPKPVPKVEVTPTKKTSSPSQKKETTFDVTKELTIDTSFDNKENNKNISSQVTPIKQTKAAQFEPVTPLQNATNHIPGPQATSTPAPNGMVNGPSVSPPLSKYGYCTSRELHVLPQSCWTRLFCCAA